MSNSRDLDPRSRVRRLEAHFELLDAQGTGRSKAAQVAELLPTIEAALQRGFSRAAVADALKAEGIDVSPALLSTYLMRFRQRGLLAGTEGVPVPASLGHVAAVAVGDEPQETMEHPAASPAESLTKAPRTGSPPPAAAGVASPPQATTSRGPADVSSEVVSSEVVSAEPASPTDLPTFKYGPHDPRRIDEARNHQFDMNALKALGRKPKQTPP